MTFNLNAEASATYHHSGLGFKLSYPGNWHQTPAEATDMEFASTTYFPSEVGEFVILLEAREVIEGKLQQLSVNLVKDLKSNLNEIIQDTTSVLLEANEVYPDTVSIESDIKEFGSKGIKFQKLKYLGLDVLVACFRVGEHIVTIQIMQAQEDQSVERLILESVEIDFNNSLKNDSVGESVQPPINIENIG